MSTVIALVLFIFMGGLTLLNLHLKKLPGNIKTTRFELCLFVDKFVCVPIRGPKFESVLCVNSVKCTMWF